MNKTLYYVFDPLCGWCYGAGAAVAALEDVPGLEVELLPSGLFSGEGARSMDDSFAAYAWSNDQRIERLTGQPFSGRYRSKVLADRQQRFDSGAATLALTAVALISPQRELEASRHSESPLRRWPGHHTTGNAGRRVEGHRSRTGGRALDANR